MKYLSNLSLFVLLFGFAFLSQPLFSQTNSPLIGYDRFKWEETLDNVKKVYPSLVEENSDDSSYGVRQFVQKNVGNGIEDRTFYFLNNKLYRVYVNYGTKDFSYLEPMIQKLVEIYGKFDDTGETPSGNMTIYFFTWNYNTNLSIQLRAGLPRNQSRIILGCNYSNPKTLEQIKELQNKSKREQLGL